MKHGLHTLLRLRQVETLLARQQLTETLAAEARHRAELAQTTALIRHEAVHNPSAAPALAAMTAAYFAHMHQKRGHEAAALHQANTAADTAKTGHGSANAAQEAAAAALETRLAPIKRLAARRSQITLEDACRPRKK
jgi:phage gp16-like protein